MPRLETIWRPNPAVRYTPRPHPQTQPSCGVSLPSGAEGLVLSFNKFNRVGDSVLIENPDESALTLRIASDNT